MAVASSSQVMGLRTNELECAMWRLLRYALPNDLMQKQPKFLGVFPHDEFPLSSFANRPSPNPIFCILNTDPAALPGKHWLAVFLPSASEQNTQIEFFDSFGNAPSYYKLPVFPTNTCFNAKRLQSYRSRVCGHYCLLFLYLRVVVSNLQCPPKSLNANLLFPLHKLPSPSQLSPFSFICKILHSQASTFQERDNRIFHFLNQLLVLAPRRAIVSHLSLDQNCAPFSESMNADDNE